MQNEQLWIDLLTGMQGRAACIVGDEDGDHRNRNWYARKVYGDKYDEIRNDFQDEKMEEIIDDYSFNRNL